MSFIDEGKLRNVRSFTEGKGFLFKYIFLNLFFHQEIVHIYKIVYFLFSEVHLHTI